VTLAQADERVDAIAAGPAGELYVAGSRAPAVSFSTDRVDGFLRRVDPTSFATVWDRPIDNCFWDSINDVAVLPGGDVVVVGATRSGFFASTQAKLLVRRYSSSGHMRWQATPDTALGSVVAHAVTADPTNGTIVITGAVSDATTMAPLLARLDGLGAVRRLTSLGTGAGGAASVGRDVAVACGGALAIITRDSGNVARVLALNADASVRWTATEPAGSEGAGIAFAPSDALYAVSTVRGAGTTLGSLARYSSTGALEFRHTIDLSTRHHNPIGGLAVRGADAVVVGAALSAVGATEPFLRVVSPTGVVATTRMYPGIVVSQVTDVALSGSLALIAAQQRPAGPLSRTRILPHAF
jgi:hypothetical protein